MKPFGKLLPFAEALDMVLEAVKPITRTETVSLDDCQGRVLAEDMVASRSTPPFDRAAMDGYAVKAEDTFDASRRRAVTLDVIFAIHAGQTETKRLLKGQCIQIATGAKMPPGADAVVMVEDTEKEDGRVKIFKAAYPKAHVAEEGEDIRQGEFVLKKGILLDAAKIGVLASQGLTEVKVFQRPQVAVLPTGEEVAEVGSELKPGQIYDINSHTIAAVARASGCRPLRLGIASDTPDELKAALARALESDLVVISGGSSVGERDLLFAILKEQGRVLFHGIQVKPGKPTLFALVKGRPVMGMPGYPTSCLINAYLLLEPALRKLANLPPKRRLTVTARLGASVPGSVGRRQFLTVKLQEDRAVPIFKESGAITGTAQADGYIEMAPNIDMLKKGEEVTVILF
ncbi:MAG: gephyrin-like molybdotransferase Glp [Dehalococcoidales bacterium]